jgi:L-histidine Nalpha-methyltransferase
VALYTPRGAVGVSIRHAARPSPSLEKMAAEVREGLSRRPLPELPSKYFYDERGSTLFDAITRQPEYYPTRIEEGILEAAAAEIVAAVRPFDLVELGSGESRKIRFFLDAMRDSRNLSSCELMDISETALARSLPHLERAYPEAQFEAIVGDFVTDIGELGPGGGRLLLLLAGTIGNLHPEDVPAFLQRARTVLARNDGFLVGIDLVKERGRLEAAYNDAAGVTAEFNRNILRVMNERLGADFDPAGFDHVAFYDEEHEWVEMRLRSRRAITVHIPAAGVDLDLPRGGEIRTEISCKYTAESFRACVDGSGLRLAAWLTDETGSFANVLLRPQ